MRNVYNVQNNVTLINVWCSNGWLKQHESLAALVDTDDMQKLVEVPCTWYASRAKAPRGKYYVFAKFYDRQTKKLRTVSLHRFILDQPIGMDVHHRDNDGLNCRRSNLQVCTHKENHRKRSPLKNWDIVDFKRTKRTDRSKKLAAIRKIVADTGYTRQYVWKIRNGIMRHAEVERMLIEAGITISDRTAGS